MKAEHSQELINIALIKDIATRKERVRALFHVERDFKDWFLLENILRHCSTIDLNLHRLENNLNELESLHGSFSKENYDTFFSTIFHAFFMPKTQSTLALYLKGLKMDALIVLRTLIEYTAFALWADCVTRFRSTLFNFLWDPTALAGLDIHQMNSFDFNTRITAIKEHSGARSLHQREFEEEFFSRGTPTDFFLFLFKPVGDTCRNRRKGLSYLFRRAKVWEINEILGTSGDTVSKKKGKSRDDSVKTTVKQSENGSGDNMSAKSSSWSATADKKAVDTSTELQEELSYSLNSFIRRMTSAAKSRRSKQPEKELQEESLNENEREVSRLKKLEESIAPSLEMSLKQQPFFGSEHLKTCAFCQQEASSGAILQLPNFKLILIWLQKIFPERRHTFIKVKLAWTFLTENFSHFSTSINPAAVKANFDFHGREINLFSSEGMQEVFEDLFDIMGSFLAYRERLERRMRR